MPDCECLAGCPFFNDHMINMPSSAAMIKQRYCKRDNTQCARYVVFKALGKTSIPADLFPSQIEKAQMLIAKK